MRTLLCLAALVVSNVAQAGMLLGEVGINIVPTVQSMPADPNSLTYRISAAGGYVGGFPTYITEWQNQVTAADVGETFSAPSDMVSVAAQALSQSDAAIGIGFLQHSYSAEIDYLYDPGWNTSVLHSAFFVPDIRQHQIGAITMTVDSYHSEPFQGTAYRVGGGFTVRFYAVPEPAAWLLLLIAFITAGTISRRRW